MFVRFWLQILLDFDLSTLLKCVRTPTFSFNRILNCFEKEKKKKNWSQYDKQLFKKSTKHGIPTGD